MRIRHRVRNGELIDESVGEAVERELMQATDRQCGRFEQLEVKFNAITEMLVRLVDVVSDAVEPDDIYRLFDREKNDQRVLISGVDGRDAFDSDEFDEFEVIDE